MNGVRKADMTPEEVGAYIMFMCAQWDAQGPLPADHHRLSAFSGWDIRVVRRLVGRLTQLGKVQEDDGHWTNERMTLEIEKFCRRMQSARERERAKKEAKILETSAELPGEVLEKFGTSSEELREKAKEINAAASTAQTYPESEPEYRRREEEDSCAFADGERASVQQIETQSDEAVRAKPRPRPSEAQWNRFWEAYPRRKGREKARDRFFALTPADADAAIAGASAFAKQVRDEGTELRYVKYPEGWISARRWLDFTLPDEPRLEEMVGPNGKRWGWWRGKEQALREMPPERWEAAIRTAKPNGTWPWWVLTAPPGHDECCMPEEIVRKHRFDEIYRGRLTHD